MMSILSDFTDGLIMSLFSILIVFAILYLLTLSVSWLRRLKDKDITPIIPVIPPIKLEDISDPDMMVAALVAAIDYQETTHKDIRLISIKEISK